MQADVTDPGRVAHWDTGPRGSRVIARQMACTPSGLATVTGRRKWPDIDVQLARSGPDKMSVRLINKPTCQVTYRLIPGLLRRTSGAVQQNMAVVCRPHVMRGCLRSHRRRIGLRRHPPRQGYRRDLPGTGFRRLPDRLRAGRAVTLPKHLVFTERVLIDTFRYYRRRGAPSYGVCRSITGQSRSGRAPRHLRRKTFAINCQGLGIAAGLKPDKTQIF
jgi:hypothetical protein